MMKFIYHLTMLRSRKLRSECSMGRKGTEGTHRENRSHV